MYNDAVSTAIVRAVSSDPDAFTDDEGWWTNYFTELEWSLPCPVAGEVALCRLVRQDPSGQWVLDHPGFEDED